MGRTLATIVLGAATAATLVAVGQRIVAAAGAALANPDLADPAFVVLALGLVLLAATGGGWVAARVAPERPFRHALYLAAALGGLGLVALVAHPVQRSPGDLLLLVVVPSGGAVLGGRLGSPAGDARGPAAASAPSPGEPA